MAQQGWRQTVGKLLWAMKRFVVQNSYGRTVHGYSLELVRLQDTYYCDALDLLMQVILPECHRAAVIWFPVWLGWGCVGTVCFFRRIWYKLLEGLHLTITVPLPLMQDDWNHTRSITA